MSKRIQPLQDPKVQAAIEEVKRAALAVSGDLAVNNVVVLIDFKKAGGGGHVDLFMDVCACPGCLNRMTAVIAEGMASAEETRAAGQGPVVKH